MCMDGSDRIVFILYIRKDILALITYSFTRLKSVSQEMEQLNQRIADFRAFKEEAGIKEIICNKIQTSILLRKEYLETVILNN